MSDYTREAFERDRFATAGPVQPPATPQTTAAVLGRAVAGQFPATPQEPSEPQVDVVRLLRQCQDISHILGEVGCQAMPLVDGVRWLVDKQTALRAENTRLREREARLREALAACYEGLDTHWKEYPEHQPFIELARAALLPPQAEP